MRRILLALVVTFSFVHGALPQTKAPASIVLIKAGRLIDVRGAVSWKDRAFLSKANALRASALSRRFRRMHPRQLV